MFHKNVHRAWNIFKRLEQLLENSVKIQFSRVSIDQEESSINQRLFSIDQTGIEHQLKQAENLELFSLTFRLIE